MSCEFRECLPQDSCMIRLKTCGWIWLIYLFIDLCFLTSADAIFSQASEKLGLHFVV